MNLLILSFLNMPILLQANGVKMKYIKLVGLLLLLILSNNFIYSKSKKIKDSVSAIKNITKKLKHKTVFVNLKLDFRKKTYQLKYNGIIVDKSGLILIPFSYKKDDIRNIQIWINEIEHTGKMVQINKQIKMALIKVKSNEIIKQIEFSKTPIKNAGEPIFIQSNSGDENLFRPLIDIGMFMGYKFLKIDEMLTSDINIFNGFLPGSTILNLNGKLVGITNDSRKRGILAIYDLRKKISKMISKQMNKEKTKLKKDGKPYLGFMRKTINKNYADYMDLPKSSILVTKVFQNSPAQKGGLKDNDLIIAVDEIPLQGYNYNVEKHFMKLFDPEIGNMISFTVLRNGKNKKLILKFIKKPEPVELKTDSLGLTIAEIRPVDYYSYELFNKTGLYIKKIEPGSPAATSSDFGSTLLNRMDIILNIDNQKIETMKDFKVALKAIKKKE